MSRNKTKINLLHVPLRMRPDQVERLEAIKVSRGYETLSPVTRLAIEKGLAVLEGEERRAQS
ncbi:MAG: hypothetical protein AB1450_08245 [Pseudomonadota bacterium]